MADTTEQAPPEPIEAGDAGQSEDEFEPQEWESSSSGSASVTSSILQHAYANGRRYHYYRDGKYPIPNDDVEQNREDMKHAMVMELTDGKLFHARIGETPGKFWIWELELIYRYLGDRRVSPNVHFIVDDVEDEWLSGDNFDFIHMRNLASLVHDLPKLLERVYANLKPGAWVETQDFSANVACDDGTMPDDWYLLQFWEKIRQAMSKLNIDIQKTSYKVPIGTWPKDKTLRLVVMYMRTVTEDFLGAAASKPLAALGMGRTEIEVFLALVRKAIRDPEVHAYGTYYSWTGQKPRTTEGEQHA
ncbi:Secondary metabolism regulator LAE1 [Colletotrichum tropicale]|nr:Secondary metabolism regulator LAE1 [Colletotrichum tropicale]